MTRRTNARVAGFAFLIYIAVALTGMVLENRAASGEGAAAKLASIARHASGMRVAVVLAMLGCFCALVLAVTLYAITRDQDPDLAMLVLVFRAAEGTIGAVSLSMPLGLLWLATANGASAPDPAAASGLGAVLLNLESSISTLTAAFFAVGSLVFSYLLVRGRIVPVPAGLGGPPRVDPRRDRSSPAARRDPPQPGYGFDVVAAARLRDPARLLADHQGRRHAAEAAAHLRRHRP